MQRGQYVVGQAGSTVRLRCPADAVPPPSVVWFKHERLLVTPSRRSAAAAAAGDEVVDDIDDDEEAGFVLRLSSVTQDDSGLYTCRVFNNVGHINFTYTLHVTGLSVC